KKGRYVVNGDPTDGALLIASRKMGIKPDPHEYQTVKEVPFDSERKRMSVIVEDKAGRRFLIVKGAPEVLLPRSSYVMGETGKRLMKQVDKQEIDLAMDNMAEQALRTIAIGIKPLKPGENPNNALMERELTFI